MSIVSEPAQWKVRTLGAALGAGFSGLLGLLLFWTGLWLYVGIVGIPAGAIVGAIFAPRLARSSSPMAGAIGAAAVASLITIGGHIAVYGVALALDPSSSALLAFGVMAVSFAIGGLVVGFPAALVVAWLATWSGRRVAGQADDLWLPAVVAAMAMAALTGLHAARQLGFLPF